MPLLVVERGNDKGLSVKIEPAKAYVVGRENPHAAVKLSDPMASRAHFQISSTNGSWRVKDMKSRNGTLLNDEKLPPDADTALKIGDKIQVGETIFSFLSDEKEETAGGLIGKTIGGYQLLERVGRGGMGTVYKAEQISLKRVVALKVLSAKLLSDPVFVERFVQEARAAGGLTHPNIVQVIDVGSDRGIYYFSMEYMDNGSVGDVVAKEGPIPWERALAMMTDAARGLIFAEKKGIIHRDIKPDNLMLTSEGSVKIGDLGLAKKAEDVTSEGGQIFGTPHFIAPEQAQGKPVDNRADIYALGATFYRVLSGKTPFTGENVKEILLKQIQQEPEPIVKLVEDLPEEMAAVLGKMMKKKADERYRSAQGLFEDLERIRVSYHLEARGQKVSARRTKALAAVLFLAVVGLGGVVYHFATREREVEWRDKPNQNPIQNPNPNPVPTISPEKQAELDFLTLGNEELALKTKLGADPANSWKTHEKEWTDLVEKLEKFAGAHQGTPKASEARADAKGIKDAIDASKAAWDAKVAKLKADREKASTDAKALLAEGKYAEAVAKLKRETDALLNKDRDSDEILGGSPRRTAKEEILALIAAARDKAEALEKTALETAPKFPGKDYLAAFFALDALRVAVAPADFLKDDASTDLREIVAKIADTLKTTRNTAEEAAREAIDQDESAYFTTYLRIRRLAPSIPSNLQGFEESPFFALKWDDAISLWTALRKEQRTKAFQDRVDAKIAQYQRCKRFFTNLAAKIKAGKVENPDFPKAVKKGSSLILDGKELDKATPDGCRVLRTQSRESVFVYFRDMTPDEFYDLFLKKGADLPLDGEDHLDLAVFLAEAGSGESAWGEFGASQSGQPPAAEGREHPLCRWVENECIQCANYHLPDGIAALKLHYEQAKKDGATIAEMEKRRKDIEDKAGLLRADEKYFTSDLSILFLSEMGTASAVPDRLLPVAVSDEIVQKLGVMDGPGLPKEEDAPPPPPKDGNDGGLVPNPGAGKKEEGKKDDGNPPPPPPGGEKRNDGTEKPK